MKNVQLAIKTILELGLKESDFVEIRSEEGVEYRGKSINAALDTIMNLEDCGINFVKEGGFYVGWIGVQPGEQTAEDAIYDYDDNDAINKIMLALRNKGLLK